MGVKAPRSWVLELKAASSWAHEGSWALESSWDLESWLTPDVGLSQLRALMAPSLAEESMDAAEEGVRAMATPA